MSKLTAEQLDAAEDRLGPILHNWTSGERIIPEWANLAAGGCEALSVAYDAVLWMRETAPRVSVEAIAPIIHNSYARIKDGQATASDLRAAAAVVAWINEGD